MRQKGTRKEPMEASQLSKEQVDEGIADLDRLSREEYGYGIDELLADPDTALATLRLQRLTGILLKCNFAKPVPIDGSPTETHAHRAWIWKLDKFSDPRLVRTPEFEVLDELRRDLPRQRNYDSGSEPTFQELTDEAEHERGLFKVLALWLDDKLKKETGRTFKEYFEAQESPRFEAALNASTLVLLTAVGPILAPFLPVPGIVVSVILIGVQFGYRSITDAAERGDSGT